MFHQIQKDLTRMTLLYRHPDMLAMFERILFIWSMRHPGSGYVQGINDLLIPFFVVFLSEYIRVVLWFWLVPRGITQTEVNINGVVNIKQTAKNVIRGSHVYEEKKFEFRCVTDHGNWHCLQPSVRHILWIHSISLTFPTKPNPLSRVSSSFAMPCSKRLCLHLDRYSHAQHMRPSNASVRSGVGVSGSEIATRPEKLSKCSQVTVRFPQPLLRKSYSLPSLGVGNPTKVRGRKRMAGALHRVD
ncbi:TBC1 domain family member 22A [Fasciola hepatica]|uniref:TBC1 domain family member 22A n=1 Tax=Fasciola hepatica TaxID=6192 RepID=A0A4E0QWB5_FASHE|nr:TBC1 domain family member 22A [Fasciola hepatica]